MKTTTCDYCDRTYTLDPKSPNLGNNLCARCSAHSDEKQPTKKQTLAKMDKAYDELVKVWNVVYAQRRTSGMMGVLATVEEAMSQLAAAKERAK